MEKLETVLQRINGREILLRLRVFLCQNSESFAEQQAAFYSAAAELESAGKDDLAKWMNDCETEVTAAVIAAAFQGFHNGEAPAPNGERPMPTMSGNVSEDLRPRVRTIRDYYERLTEDGTPIARLAGCLAAYSLLPWVRPEETPSVRQTVMLAMLAQERLGYMPFAENIAWLIKTARPDRP